MIGILREYFAKLIESLVRQWDSFSFGLNDAVDILIVAVLLYYAYKFIRERRAGKLAIGILLLIFIRIISDIFELSALGFIINNFFQIGLLAIVVLFQPELRSALEKAGGNSLRGFKTFGDQKNVQTMEQMIEQICVAACEMSKDKTGALIVFERETKLGDIAASGTVVNADVSSLLVRSLFFENSPLHDGAVIVRNGRIHAAGCFLPLSDNKEIDQELGTRHRAAIGMSEVSDSVVLVVSEETGTISLVKNGNITRRYDYTKLKNALMANLIGNDEEGSKKHFSRVFRKKEKKAEDSRGKAGPDADKND